MTEGETGEDINPIRYRGYYYDQETGLYHLWSRYYDPQTGRFISADSYASTGQGTLGYNMFAYCRNNPVCRKDSLGTYDLSHWIEDESPWDELTPNMGRSSGSGIFRDFVNSIRDAANGLKMAMGQRDVFGTERHHMFSNKNATYTPQYKEIMDRYDMSLNSKENIIELQGHHGRHTNQYHDFMLANLKQLDLIADGNKAIFLQGIDILGEFIAVQWWIPYAK